MQILLQKIYHFCKKFTFSIPRNSDILIYDASGFNFYSKYLKKYTIEKLYLRNEHINVFCLLIAIFFRLFSKETIRKNYIKIYIQLVRPKLIITWVDNNIDFYKLTSKFSKSKTLFIQNGIRTNYADIFEFLTFKKNSNFNVDYMCVFNSHIGNYYSKFIKGNVVVTGSLINNNLKLNKNFINSDTVLFISQYNPELSDSSIISSKLKINSRNFFQTEIRTLKYLIEWCSLNNKKLCIAGRTNLIEEFYFFNSILGQYNNWKFFGKKNKHSTYNLFSKSNFIVSICSTIGIEALARNFKVAIISRKADIKIVGSSFGWPYKLPDNGFFWTSKKNKSDVFKVFNNVSYSNKKTWINNTSEIANELLKYDFGNKIFARLINNIFKNK